MDSLQDLETAKANFFQCSIGKKELEMLSIKEVADAYPCDGDMAKNPHSILFQLVREIAISERSRTELRVGLVKIAVALDESNGSKIFWMCFIQHGYLCLGDN